MWIFLINSDDDWDTWRFVYNFDLGGHLCVQKKLIFNNALNTFKIWLNEYFLNSWHHNCEKNMKNVLEKEKFKCFCNLCATKVNNNLKITSFRSSLDLGNKNLNWKTIYQHSFSLQKPSFRFFIFATVGFEII